MAEMRRSIIFALIMASPGLVAAVLLSEREYNWTEVQQAEVDAVNVSTISSLRSPDPFKSPPIPLAHVS